MFRTVLPMRVNRILPLFVLLLTSLLYLSCESETKLSVTDKVPPTFQVHGNGDELFFSVYEVTSERDRYGRKAVVVWAFKSKQRGPHKSWVSITYGQVPEEFEQTFPTSGEPSPLVEDKLYGASATIYGTAGDKVWFKLKDGKTSRVSAPD
jgi:hypothetical protein